jgi:hypothetical protein
MSTRRGPHEKNDSPHDVGTTARVNRLDDSDTNITFSEDNPYDTAVISPLCTGGTARSLYVYFDTHQVEPKLLNLFQN